MEMTSPRSRAQQSSKADSPWDVWARIHALEHHRVAPSL